MAEPILELYLARHGQSTGNAGLTDGADPSLTDLGRTQARLLGEFYARIPFDAILSSGLERALETAEAVASRQARPVRVEVHPVFTECGVKPDFGEKPFEEIAARHPYAVPAAGLSPDESFVFTGDGETDDARFARARQALAYLFGRFHEGQRVLVAAHAEILTFLLFAALDLGPTPKFDFSFVNTGVTKLLFYKAGEGPYGADVHLVFHNDRSHLAEDFADALINAR